MRYTVQVRPGATRERVELLVDSTLAVWVNAPPREGRANRAVLALLADQLKLRPREVVLVAGERGRRKLVELPLDADEVRARLGGT